MQHTPSLRQKLNAWKPDKVPRQKQNNSMLSRKKNILMDCIASKKKSQLSGRS